MGIAQRRLAVAERNLESAKVEATEAWLEYLEAQEELDTAEEKAKVMYEKWEEASTAAAMAFDAVEVARGPAIEDATLEAAAEAVGLHNPPVESVGKRL
jgi:hypothetical protein